MPETEGKPLPTSRYRSAYKLPLERCAAERLMATVHIYDRVGHDKRAMVFRADGTIGLGAAGREMFWDVCQDAQGDMTLSIASTTELTCLLHADDAGAWHGRWLHAEKMPITVSAAEYSLPVAPDPAQSALCGEPDRPPQAIKVGLNGMFTRPRTLPVYSDIDGSFRTLKQQKVLAYFRHGFGDWVQMASCLPLLARANRLWFTRFGDDYTSLLEGSAYAVPVYLGVNSIHCQDGAHFHNADFGMDRNRGDGSPQTLNMPLSLEDICLREGIDSFLHITFPEVMGWTSPPFHTKARNMLHQLSTHLDPAEEELSRPLQSGINFTAEPQVLSRVQTRLRNVTGYGDRKLCLISRNGYTHTGKNWGHRWREDMPPGKQREGEECRDFMRLMLEKDPRWLFLVMEDTSFKGDDTLASEELHCYSYFDLFGGSSPGALPFGRILKTLVHLTDLAIGVPTGPYHLCMAHPEIPTVGLWFEHMPSWYDEPKENSIHLMSRNISEAGIDRRPGSFTDWGDLHFRTIFADTRILTGQQVMDAAEMLLG